MNENMAEEKGTTKSSSKKDKKSSEEKCFYYGVEKTPMKFPIDVLRHSLGDDLEGYGQHFNEDHKLRSLDSLETFCTLQWIVDGVDSHYDFDDSNVTCNTVMDLIELLNYFNIQGNGIREMMIDSSLDVITTSLESQSNNDLQMLLAFLQQQLPTDEELINFHSDIIRKYLDEH